MRRGFLKTSTTQSRPAQTDAAPARGSQRRVIPASSLFKLSDNLLLKIFTLASRPKLKINTNSFDIDNHSTFFTKKVDPLPFRLSHTSSRLRTLALSTPALWATLGDFALRSSALLDIFLVRSKEEPLDICISASYISRRRLNQLVAHVHRWRKFIIDNDTEGFEDMSDDASEGDLDLDDLDKLKSLSDTILRHFEGCAAPKLEYLDLGYISSEELIFILSGGTPALNTLKVAGAPIFPADCSSLKRLSLYTSPGEWFPFDHEDLEDLWGDMLSLTHIQIRGEIVPRWPEISDVSPVKMPSLRFLDICLVEDEEACPMIQPHCVSALLATISAESLGHLSLSYMAPEILSSFLTNLQKGTFCFPRVTSLTWGTHLTKEQDVKSIAQYFPAVRTLTLDQCEAECFLKALLPGDETSPVLWSALRRLNLQWAPIPLLRNFVTARSRCGHPIQRIWLLKVTGLASDANRDHLKWLGNNIKLRIVSNLATFQAEAIGWHKAV
ncbi:hypothetical protein Hypma_009824 [Hypsizygus marmoreus]|uniref:F-box domain-containing protein n=1 Tax=Hypsizygus marmoreus TaxID=39966 RepID=A0A369JW33_HYPMA|nr:hypothetical protein Hypma_009824 [Hypsizygus marmoreus]